MSNSSLKFGLVGCGRIAPKHAEALTGGQVKNATLAAVCDIVPEKAAAFGKKHGVPYYTDMHEMMQKENLDVVSILTPSGYHAKHAIELSKYKKHIVVEKPMALTVDDAEAMTRACDAAGIRLFVVKQNRYNPFVVELHKAIEEKRFGKLVLGTVRVRWSRDQKYYDQDSWRGTWALDGGVFTNQASHHIDLLIWMLGPVESVFAKSATALVKIEAEDTGVAVIKFKSGALGIVEATTATRPKDLEGSISILGERGSVEIAGFAVNELRTWNFLEETAHDQKLRGTTYEKPPNVYGFGHIAYLKHVVESLQSKGAALVDGLEGRKSIEVINALYESIETGKEVFLNFKPEKCRLGSSRP